MPPWVPLLPNHSHEWRELTCPSHGQLHIETKHEDGVTFARCSACVSDQREIASLLRPT